MQMQYIQRSLTFCILCINTSATYEKLKEG